MWLQERTVSEQVLAEAEKRAELATRLLQEVQAERYEVVWWLSQSGLVMFVHAETHSRLSYTSNPLRQAEPMVCTNETAMTQHTDCGLAPSNRRYRSEGLVSSSTQIQSISDDSSHHLWLAYTTCSNTWYDFIHVPTDSPPKKPKRPPEELLGKYRAELRSV